MSLVVEHVRQDDFLESYTEELDPNLKGTYIEQVTLPYHRFLLQFLDLEVVNRPFNTSQELQVALDRWPEFLEEQGVERPHHDWDRIDIVGSDRIACGESPGGDFIIGRIETR